MELRLVYYRCRDHFTTNTKNESECIQEGVGIFESEDEIYLKLKIIDADINMKDSEKEYNNILKSALVYRKEAKIEVTY